MQSLLEVLLLFAPRIDVGLSTGWRCNSEENHDSPERNDSVGEIIEQWKKDVCE